MFVQLICKDRNQSEMNELYEVIGALCKREGIQAEDRLSHVEVLVCPQGKILVTEDDKDLILSANTRHAGPGFHAFVVDFFQDIEEELPGEYELNDDLEFTKDGDFHRLEHMYENELDYIRKLIKQDPGFKNRNYLFDETYYLPIAGGDKVLTSAGEMNKEEFESKALDDLMDYFYVWNDYDRDARFYRNAALTLLAKEGYGQFSMMNETTEKYANEIVDYLQIAHELDPKLPLPLDAYNQLCTLLNRENKLKDAINMDREATLYRTREVYHLFEDARIVAPGTAERSYDPVTQSMNLMAPYTEESEWSWLIQASKQPSIVSDLKALQEAEPEHLPNGNICYMDAYSEEGLPAVDAILQHGEKILYVHALARTQKELDAIEKDIKRSGFVE
jgi:tetratricopeptide (TPR) repeat protein